MPNYRRAIVPGGSFFFTVVVHRRRPLFDQPAATALLGSVFRRCLMRWPFTVNAVVLLPDHLHTIWSLPPGDSDYSKRWGWLKKEFTKSWLQIGGQDYVVSEGRKRQRRRGIWQPRFWEHTLEDEDDFEAHFDYIHWNPVKHGHVDCPHQWPHSSFHRYVRLGVYDRLWGCFTSDMQAAPFDCRNLEDRTGEPA
jgi:putative transposase